MEDSPSSKPSNVTIIDISGAAHTLLDSHSYKSSDVRNDFFAEVRSLDKLKEDWRKISSAIGLDEDDFPRDWTHDELQTIQAAYNELLTEIDKLKSRQSLKSMLSPKRSFRSSVVKSVVKAKRILSHDIDRMRKDERWIIKSLQDTFDEEFSMDFEEDGKYVPLDSENKVVEALKSRGAGLVLLHGGPGKGKSTLARSLALQVRSRHFSATGTSVYSEPPNFQLAIFLNCGKGSDKSGKDPIQQLRDCLKLDSLYGKRIARRLGLDESHGEEVVDMETQENVLRRLLKDEQVLIICDGMFDPLRHPDILQRMINLTMPHIGENVVNVKILVTSRSVDLCNGLNFTNLSFTSLSVGDISSHLAKEILASHFGWLKEGDRLQKTDAVETLKGLESVNDVIKSTDGNPFALACVAKHFRSEDYILPERWANANRNLSELLEKNNTAKIHNVSYGPSLWKIMKEEFEKALTVEESNFLLLIHLCTSTVFSIFRSVIEFLYKQIFQLTSRSFLITVWSSLESKAFIKRNGQLTNSWLVQSLARTFIDKHKPNEQKTILEKLVNNLPDIYFVVAKDVYKGHAFDFSFKQQVRDICILFPYNLANDAIMTKIVKLPEALQAFERVLSKHTEAEDLEFDYELFEQAMRALTLLTKGTNYVRLKVADSWTILKRLVNITLNTDYNPNLQKYAATTLANLTAEGFYEVHWKIAEKCGWNASDVNSDDENSNLPKLAKVLNALAEGGHHDANFLESRIAENRDSPIEPVESDVISIASTSLGSKD